MSPAPQSYELHLEHRDGRTSFEPLVCFSSAEILPKVRKILQERDLEAIEVRFANQLLFTLGR